MAGRMEEIDRRIRNASSLKADRDGHTDFVEGSDVQESKGQSHIATDRRDEREHCVGRKKELKMYTV